MTNLRRTNEPEHARIRFCCKVRSLHVLRGVASTIDNAREVRNTLEIAAVFARGFDFPGAVARAKDAVRMATGADARDEAILELRGFEAKNRAWHASVEARQRMWRTEELAADRTPKERSALPDPRRTWRKLVRRLRQETRAAEGAGVIALDNQP